MPRAALFRPAEIVLLVALLAAVAACDVVAPTNPFDPDTPAALQAPGSLHGAIVLRDAVVDGETCGASDAISRITVSLRDAGGRLLRDGGVVVERPLIDVGPIEDGAGMKGRFVVDDLSPGIYAIVFHDIPASYGAIGDVNVVVTAGGDADMGTLDLDYAPGSGGPYGIDGALDLVGVTTSAQQRISLYRSTSPIALASQVGNGAFSFAGLCPGTYAVVAEADGAMPAYRLDIVVGAAQPQTSFVDDDALPLLPVGAVLLPVATGPGAVVIDDGQAWVREQPVPLTVLAVDGGGIGGRIGIRQMRLSTRSDFADATFVDYAAAATVALPDEDGRYTIHAQFRPTSDAGFDFPLPVFSTEVFRDTEAPTIDPDEIVVLGATRVGDRFLVNTRTTAVRALLRDDMSGFAVADVGVDGPPALAVARRAPPGEQTLNAPVAFASDGLHTVVVLARDRAGNETIAEPVEVLVDTVAPEVVVEVDNAPTGVLAGRSVQLRVTSNLVDDVDLLAGAAVAGSPVLPTVPFSIDERGASSASITLPLPGDALAGGLLSIDVVVEDVVGNRTSRTVDVLLPAAPSAARLVLDGGAFYTRDRAVAATFAAEGAVAVTLAAGSFETTVPLDAAGSGAATITLPDDGDGTYAVSATFQNATGATKTTAASIVLDTHRPSAPTIAHADVHGFVDAAGHRVASGASEPEVTVVYPRREVDVEQVFPRKVNADTLVVALAVPPRAVDVNFDHYEVARSFGYDDGLAVPVPPDDKFETVAGTDGLQFPLVQGAPGNGVPPTTRGCTDRACLNHLFVRAVDVVDNKSAVVRIDVVEDSGPPTKPRLSPRAGAMVGAAADIRVEQASVDDSDFCDDEGRCQRGTCVQETAACLDDGAAPAIERYEVKAGTDGAFGAPPATQNAAGPWRLAVARTVANDVCARGVDDAGNVGIEDCVGVDEGSLILRVATGGRERLPKVAGDYVVYESDGDPLLKLVDLQRGGVVGPSLPFQRRPATTLDIAVHTAKSDALLVDRGDDRIAIVSDHVLLDELAVAPGAPAPTSAIEAIAVRYASPTLIQSAHSLRFLAGASPSLSGNGVFYVCDGKIVRADLDVLYESNRTFAGVGVFDQFNRVAGLGGAGSCARDLDNDVGIEPAFRALVALPAGRRLCERTVVKSDGASIVWCETDVVPSPLPTPPPTTTDTIRFATFDADGALQGAIVDVDASTPTQPLGVVDHGALIASDATIIQPFLTPTRIVWAHAASKDGPALLVERARSGAVLAPANATARNLDVADLYDVDGDQLVFARQRPDGLSEDLFLLDLTRSDAPTALSADLVPNPDASIDDGRIVSTSLSRLNEDVALRRLDTESWLESGESVRSTPVTSGVLAAWVDLVDGAPSLVAEEIATGRQQVVLTGGSFNDGLTFVGGQGLGRPTHDVGGRRVSYAHRDGATGPFTVHVVDVSVAPSPAPLEFKGVAPADGTLVGQTSLAWDLDVDGDAAAWIDDADGVLHVEKLTATTRTPFTSVASGYDPGKGDAGVVPFVSLDESAGTATVVWQLGNTASSADLRATAGSGDLYCATSTGQGVIGSASLIVLNTDTVRGALRARAPVVAATADGTWLAYSVVVAPGNAPASHRTHVCRLKCGATESTCEDDRQLEPLFRDGDSGEPALSRRGVVVWPDGIDRASPQIDRYDIARNERVTLTAGRDDDVARDTVSLADDVAVWPDTRLGTNDIWFATLP